MTSALPAASLRDRINRIAYVVINVTDLERSRAFYEAVTPLRVVARLDASLQAFPGLGIAEGEFTGYVMEDGTGRSVQIQLVEWKTPKPVGRHYSCFWHIGLAKIAILTPSAPAKLAQLKKLGIRPTNAVIQRGYTSIIDPDGVVISFPGLSMEPLLDGDDPRRSERLQHVNPAVTDVRRSMRFYGETLGLDLDVESMPCEPTPSSQGPGSDISQWDSHLYIARGDGRFRVDLSQFHHPAPGPETSAPFAEAYHVGISRIGFEVDDVDACEAILRQTDPVCGAPGPMVPVETWDLGCDVGKKRMLCFRDPDGIRLELVEKVEVKPLERCHQPSPAPTLTVNW